MTAPSQLHRGDVVRVNQRGEDGAFPVEYAGRTGVIERRQHGTDTVGGTPKDPFLTVRFGRAGTKEHDGFWSSELALVRRRPRARR